ncbi:MAG: TerB family tellurite resistance protein [Gemmatimonadota bacterium]|nr:MAG: TerB family tellurite resistance protein [Gemmatimonadota bacterium]
MTKFETPSHLKRLGAPGVKLGREWTPAHDLVNLYLGIAVLADNELDPEEQRIFMRKFGGWMPKVPLEEFEKVWGEVMSVHRSLDSSEARYGLYLQSTINVLHSLGGNKKKLRAIIRDLVEIAGADNKLHENEVTMIKAAAITFGLSADLRLNAKTGQVELILKDAN